MTRESRKRSEFGMGVKMKLICLGMTSRQLAREVGVTDSTLCDVIAGRNNSESTKARIQEVLRQWREEDE